MSKNYPEINSCVRAIVSANSTDEGTLLTLDCGHTKHVSDTQIPYALAFCKQCLIRMTHDAQSIRPDKG